MHTARIFHQTLAKMNALVGIWNGTGEGSFPSIKPFKYQECLEIAPVPGKPVFAYSQKTKNAEGYPMHSECGYFRQLPTGAVELILAQPTGVASIEEGIFDGGELCVASKSIYRSSSAKHPFVTGFSRRFKVSPDGQTLNYEFFMSTENQTEELLHLVGSLTKSA